MATKKRKKQARKTRPRRRVSRVKAPKKLPAKKHAKRTTRKPPKRAKSRERKPAPARKRPAKKPRDTRARGRKAVQHRKPLRKAPARVGRSQRTKEAQRIERLERELRQTKETLRDLTRAGTRRIGGDGGGGRDQPSLPSDEIPRGAIVKRDSAGNEYFELPEYTGLTFDEVDWGDFDWDDVYDDVGDEDEDSYGEDAT